jgi:hypothetical protein
MSWRLVLVLGAAACSGGGASVDATVDARRCPIGTPGTPVELEIVHLDAEDHVSTTQPGQEVPLLPPPQGGFILLLGARATNLDGCNLQLTTSFRDPCSDEIIKIDQRPAILEDTGDGWGITSLSSYGNLPLCPQVTAERDLHDQPYIVSVALRDLDGNQGAADLRVVPVCPPDDLLCTCQCDHNYVVGGDCPPTGPAPPPSC